LEEPLILALQFVIHDDPMNARATCVEALCGGGIDTRELRVVRRFSRLHEARVVRLRGLVGAGVAVAVKERLASTREGDERRALTLKDLRREGYQARLAQML